MIATLVAVWRFLKTPLGHALFFASGLMIIGALVYQGGVSSGVDREKAAEVKRVAVATREAARAAKASVAISSRAQQALNAALNHNVALTYQLQQKVPTYVSSQADRRCVISRGYVELRNAAGAGVDPVPAGAGGSVDADSGLVLSDLARNDITNAAAFHAAVAEVTAWRDWYVAQAALWTKTTRAPEPAT